MALLVACALGVQMLLAGMALADAAAPVGGASFSQGCATAPSGPATDPIAPGGRGHEHGLCCILHTALAGPSAPEAVGDRLTPSSDVTLVASRENVAPARAPPELEPLAPRGPPTFQI